MITLLGSVFGLAGSLLPHLINFLKQKEDNKQQLAIMDRQLDLEKFKGSQKILEIGAETDKAQMEHIYQPQQVLGISWVDALAGSVRPILAYAFFMLYAAVKFSNFFVLYHAGQDVGWTEALQSTWHDEDWGIFSAIIAYYFGARTFSKLRSK